MALKRMAIEIGMGTDIRGADYTKAAVRALRDALWHNSLNVADAVGLPTDSMVVEVLIGVPKPGLFLSTADFYGEVAGELGIPLEDRVLKNVLSDSALKSDAVHPNGMGYGKVAEAVNELLRSSGAL